MSSFILRVPLTTKIYELLFFSVQPAGHILFQQFDIGADGAQRFAKVM